MGVISPRLQVWATLFSAGLWLVVICSIVVLPPSPTPIQAGTTANATVVVMGFGVVEDGQGNWRCSDGLISRLRGGLKVIQECAKQSAMASSRQIGQGSGGRKERGGEEGGEEGGWSPSSCVLILSGGIPPHWGAPAEAKMMKTWLEVNDPALFSLPSVHVLMETTSTSTRENAFFSFAHLKRRGRHLARSSPSSSSSTSSSSPSPPSSQNGGSSGVKAGNDTEKRGGGMREGTETGKKGEKEKKGLITLPHVWIATSPFHRFRSERVFRRLSLTFGVDMAETEFRFAPFLYTDKEKEGKKKQVWDGVREVLATLLYILRRWV
mmetsp:Transcript_1031/g.2152  ORF Transcript_1031/g.2152 Transcript_1031/m.2152 type:complete len:323 (-) Transcript_1031:97-1065(-)